MESNLFWLFQPGCTGQHWLWLHWKIQSKQNFSDQEIENIKKRGIS